MVPINHYPQDLVNVVRCWAGWGIMPAPSRSDDRLKSQYGAARGSELLPFIKSLESDFYLSTAHLTAKNLQEMAASSSFDFKEKHPEIPHEVIEVFVWCYTFDYR